MPPSLQLAVERTLTHCRSHCWAHRTVHVSSLFVNRAAFSSSPPTDVVTSTTRSKGHKHPSVLERNKLQEYLNLVASSNELTVQDIERHKPDKHAPPGTSRYESNYEELVKTLSRSFTVKQLKDTHRLFGIELPKKRTKREFAISIIERQWRWPSLSESLKQRRDRTEVISQVFPLNTQEAFLLLGKDGSNLHTLSYKYNVRASFTPDPFSLTVKGVRGSVEKIARYINAFKSDVVEDIFRLPTEQEVSPKLSQRVSRLSGALVESRDKHSLRVTYHGGEPRAKHIAKALTLQAAYESLEQAPLLASVSKTNTFSSLTSNIELSHGFSLYPFIPVYSLPWTMMDGSVFRVRDVGGWFDYNEMKHTTMLSRDHLTIGIDGQVEDLRKRLLGGFANTVDSEKTSNSLHVSLGHSLLYVPSTASNAFIPPVTGNSPLPELLQKVKKLNKQQIFVPSIPKQLMELIPHRQRLLHRLIYHAVPKVTDCSTALAPINFVMLEFKHDLLPTTEENATIDSNSADKIDDSPDKGEETLGISGYVCSTGSVSMTDLLLPERVMDLRFSIVNASDTPESQWPKGLHGYRETLNDLSTSSLDASRANAPRTLSNNDTTFVLRSSTLIRQSIDSLQHISSNTGAIQIVSESVLDLNSNEKYATCKVTCDDLSENSWEQLMLACDWLTAHPKPSIPFTQGTWQNAR
ncbi:hypothetical protein AX15_006647 [Amanita polypyramis BW_CC]|nr:hypothetical protein AX15_006647 [Amanita polypyramis BW_CC]